MTFSFKTQTHSFSSDRDKISFNSATLNEKTKKQPEANTKTTVDVCG